MFQRLKSAIWRFMYGRYGTDKLNMVLLGSGVVLCLISMIARVGILSYVAYVPLILAIFRTFSRNLPARRKENQALLNGIARIKDRQNRYFKCPKCRQMVRVPKGKGTVKIRCPRVRRAVCQKELSLYSLVRCRSIRLSSRSKKR